MSRLSRAPRRWAAVLCALAMVTGPLATGASAAAGPLTLESAVPLAVPPRPNIATPGHVAAPPRFVAPQPLAVPPPPVISSAGVPKPPAPPQGAPPVPATSRPASPPPAPTPQSAAVAPPPRPSAPPERVTSPERVAPPAPAAPQTAALPPPPASVAPKAADVRVLFDAAESDLPAAAEPVLASVAERLRANPSLRLQLKAYASGTADTAREARQLSLARALAVRERLSAAGVRSARVDVRALGILAPDGPPDRVDVEVLGE